MRRKKAEKSAGHARKNESVVLSSAEAEQVRVLLWENRALVSRAASGALGSEYAYLLEECVGETYQTACSKASILLRHPNPEGFLLLTARHIAADMIRKHAKRLRSLPSETAEDPSAGGTMLEELIYRDLLDRDVPARLFSMLSEREREAYDALYVRQLSAEEAAKELEIDVDAVRNLKKTVVDRIAKAVREKDSDGFWKAQGGIDI